MSVISSLTMPGFAAPGQAGAGQTRSISLVIFPLVTR